MIANTNDIKATMKQGFAQHRLRRPQVRWTPEDIESVVNRMVDLREADPIPPALHLLKQAQEVLPSERRREILTLQAVPAVEKRFNQAWAESKKVPEVLKSLVVEVPTPPPPFDLPKVLAEAPVEDLAASLFGRLAKKLDALPQATPLPTPVIVPRSNGPAFPPAKTAEQQSAKPRLKRIAIVGLLADQQAAVEKQVNGKAELRFIDKEQSSTVFPASVDYVIIQKFSRHKWFYAARNQFSNNRVAFVDGGVGLVIKQVYDFISRQEKQ